MLLSTLTVANSSPITATRDIKNTATCLCLLPVRLLQLPVCRSARLLHSSTTVGTRRLFGGVSNYDSVTPVFCDVLHWLPIKDQINFKIGVLTLQSTEWNSNVYLSEMLVPVAVNLALRQNRSADHGDFTVPRAKNTSYSDCSFAIAVPMLWNSFPVELHCSSSMTIFCKRLKDLFI